MSMKMNRQRIKRLRDHLASLPDERFDLSSWFNEWHRYSGVRTSRELVSDCGTTACIGGWALALFAPNEVVAKQPSIVAQRAGELLGLNYDEAIDLFSHAPYGLDLSEVTREQAIATLDHLLETGEVDWNHE